MPLKNFDILFTLCTLLLIFFLILLYLKIQILLLHILFNSCNSPLPLILRRSCFVPIFVWAIIAPAPPLHKRNSKCCIIFFHYISELHIYLPYQYNYCLFLHCFYSFATFDLSQVCAITTTISFSIFLPLSILYH